MSKDVVFACELAGVFGNVEDEDAANAIRQKIATLLSEQFGDKVIMLTFDSSSFESNPEAVEAEIEWCRKAKGRGYIRTTVERTK